MNRRDVRATEFAQRREWAARFPSERLREMLAEGLHAGLSSAAREVLRERGDEAA
jgi:hypothetical protein